MLPINPSVRPFFAPSSAISRLFIDSLVEIFKFFNISELGQLCRTTQDWRRVLNAETGQDLWRHISIREGVPLIEKGKSENPKEEFRFLRSLTLSHRIMGRYLGEVVDLDPQGEIKPLEPHYISFDRFKQLRDGVDPFDSTQPMRDNYLVVVPPRYFKIRVSRENRPFGLDSSGKTLTEVPETEEMDEKDLVIPFSFQNLKMLTQYPLAGGNRGPCFHRLTFTSYMSDLFGQYDEKIPVQAPWNSIFIMKRESMENGWLFENSGWERGLKIIPLSLRGLANVLLILSSGTCLDSNSRSAEKIFVRDNITIQHHLGLDNIVLLGGFTPGQGLFIHCFSSRNSSQDRFALGIPAEAL